MKLITRQSEANDTFESLKTNNDPHWGERKSRVLALGPNPDPDDVDKALGYGSCTRLHVCDECGQQAVLVRFCEDATWDESTANICLACLRKAVAMIEQSSH
jgi:hypothetical protein